jgi:hypothetical protein
MKFFLVHDLARSRALEAVKQAPDGYMVEVKEPKRTLDQNAAMWPILEAFSAQLQWPVNGKPVHLDPEEWKIILTAAFFDERVRIARGLNGGAVMLGHSTSKMGKKAFSEFLEFLHATAIDRRVNLKPS